MIDTELADEVSPDLAFLFPRFVTRRSVDGIDWIGLMCRHPAYPVAHLLDPPKAYIRVGYPLGRRHQWLLGSSRDRKWTHRRVETLLRLLLKRLAREVVKVKCSPKY